MRPNALRALIEGGGTAVNAWVSCESTYLAEVLSHAGYDSVTIDLQHGMFDIGAAVGMLQAVSAGPAVPMVRAAANDAAHIGKLLDAGAYGIICPGVDSAAECAAFVEACRYPPTGRRSLGPARGLLYGGPDYLAHADAEVLTWAMVESVESLGALAEILAVPGLDGVYVGPSDLALSMGLAPAHAMPGPVLAAVHEIAAAARASGVMTGIYCGTGAEAGGLAAAGYDLVTPGNDVALVRESATRRIAEAQRRPDPEAGR